MTTTYDVMDVNLVVDGVVITGYAEGTVINATKSEDNFSTHVGVKGEVAIAETNNPTGEIEITLKNTSPSVEYLISLASRKGENALVAAQIVDLNTNGINVGGTECRVKKPSDIAISNEETQRTFSIFIADYTIG